MSQDHETDLAYLSWSVPIIASHDMRCVKAAMIALSAAAQAVVRVNGRDIPHRDEENKTIDEILAILKFATDDVRALRGAP